MSTPRSTIMAACCFTLLWAVSVHSTAQPFPLSNPSTCGIGFSLRDFSCSDDGLFRTPDRFAITVNDAPGTAMGVDVFLSEVRLLIPHAWAGDLDLYLISPSGRVVTLSTDNGGGKNNYGDPSVPNCQGYMVFSASSCRSIVEGEAPFTDGPYLPEESLLLFNDGATDPNGVWILEICDDAPEDVGTLEYVELVFAPLSCLPFTNFEAAATDTTAVRLNWQTPGGDCGVAIIEYGPPGFRPGSGFEVGEGVVVQAVCPPFTLPNLAPETNYDFYLRRSCIVGGFSANSCVAQARTGCRPPPTTIVANFEAETTCGQVCGAECPLEGPWWNGPDGDFDWLVNQGPTPTQGTGPAAAANGAGKYVYLEATDSPGCRPGNRALLYSNCIRFDRRGGDTCHLSFQYHMFGADIGTLRLEMSPDGGLTWNLLWERRGNQGNAWRKAYLALDMLADGDTAQFRFVGIKTVGAQGDIALDEIVFHGSEDLGRPDNIFYVDADGDGYGDPDRFLWSCAATPPPGYSAIAGDCDDNNPNINPGMPEIPCDGVDNNCSGEDDLRLPTPIAEHDTICSGQTATICARPVTGKLIFWFGSADGPDFLGVIGECYTPVLPPNNGSTPVVYRFYAEETDFICRSGVRAEVVIVVNPLPRGQVLETPAICPGQSIDLASVDIIDERFTGAELSFHSDRPASEANRLDNTLVTPQAASTYTYLLRTPAGCGDEGQFTVGVLPGPELRFTPGATLEVCRESVQTINVEAVHGSAPYTYLWSTGATGETIEAQPAFAAGARRVFGVTVTDAEGCFSSDSATLVTRVNIEAVQRQVEEVGECSGSDGRITLRPLSGLPPFRFTWNSANGVSGQAEGIAETFTIDNLPQGTYQITITDNSTEPCAFLMRSVVVNGPNAMVSEPLITPVRCASDSDGSICLPVSGENPTFLWSTGDTTSCVEGLSGGVYSVTVSEGDCENILVDLEMPEPTPLLLSVEAQAPTCHDAADGSLALSVFGGEGNYRYAWSNGSAAARISDLSEGQYSVTVSDANDCLLVDTLALVAPPPLVLNVDTLSGVRCAGEANAFIRVSGQGGASPYRYEWNNGRGAPLLFGLGPGNYSVTLTDFQGCATSRSLTVEAPTPVSLTLVEAVDPICVGDMTGRIVVAAAGGAPGYTYLWNLPGEQDTLRDLGVGEYHVLARDHNGCLSDTLPVTLNAVSSLELAALVTPPECLGAENGAITLQPSGQVPFSYQWERGDQTASIDQVGVGRYPVSIVDARGCRYDEVVVVDAPQVFTLDINVRPPSCQGGQDGAITPTVLAGGTEPLRYVWSDGSEGAALLGVGDGGYAFTLTDSRGCRYTSDTLAVAAPPALSASVVAQGRINCRGDSTGFIELDVRGGIPPYTYNWLSIDADGPAAYDLPAGIYPVEILDANDCPFSLSPVLEEAAELIVEVDVETGSECGGSGTAFAAARVRGGLAPYAYLWSNGAKTPAISGIEPGDYALTVQDVNQCREVMSSIKVREAVPALRLVEFTVTDISCAGEVDGAMTATVSGGKPPYRFHFSNNQIVVTNANSVTRTGLPRSNGYSVTVTDLNTGCTAVSERKPLREPLMLRYRVDSVGQIACFGGRDGRILASTLGGTPPYQYAWYNQTNQLVGAAEDLRQVPDGIYFGVATDARGCVDTVGPVQLISLTTALRRIDSLTVVRNARCRGESSGAVSVVVMGGTPPYQYSWSNGRQGREINNVPAGNYELTVTDANSCRAIFPPILVGQPASAIAAAAIEIGDPSCFNDADGFLRVALSGGVPPYLSAWSFEGENIAFDSLRLDGLRAGDYTLTVRDEAACERAFVFELRQPDSLAVSIERMTPGDTAQLFAAARGGTPPYDFLWSTGDTSAMIEALAGVGYGVTVVDANQCRGGDTLFLTSVFERETVRQARLFPNPASGAFTFELRLERPLSLLVEVRDQAGALIARRALDRTDEASLGFDAANWPPGVYAIAVYGAGRRIYIGRILLTRP